MSMIHVAAASLNQTALDWEANALHTRQAIEEAKAAGAQVLCLPESSITGYGCEDALLSLDVQAESIAQLVALLPLTENFLTLFGLPILHEGKLYNCVAMVANQEILGVVPKQHLAGDGVHYEPRWFSAWGCGKEATIELQGKSVPFGDLVFEVGGIRFGVEICRDAWVEERSGKSLAARGVKVILNPTASHFAFQKINKREALVRWATDNLNVAFVFSNQAGNDAGRLIYDGDLRIATPDHYWVAPRLGMERVSLIHGIIDTNNLGIASPEPCSGLISVPFSWDAQGEPGVQTAMLPWQTSQYKKEEEFTRAVSLGLFDYMIKTRVRGFVINLSGGADSAACACLVSFMLKLAEKTWGLEGLKEKFSYIPELANAPDLKTITKRLLCCVYQGSAQSSDTTANAAARVANALGATFYHWPIQSMVDEYISCVEAATGEALSWEKDDLALQNIQARVRAPAAWLIANMRGALLLATSNRSEAAVGYATMDGDTCGGLSPIAGVDKAFILQWLAWAEKKGPDGIGPMPFLDCITVQAPTAELRPGGQRDEDDLMPYVLLNQIEALAIGDKYGPVRVYQQLKGEVCDKGLPPKKLKKFVERFFILWARNQWKRERYAPAFHVDDKNLDPKTWCRFPILSGGFTKELEALRLLE